MLRLCFDVDGVVLDFDSSYAYEAKHYFGIEIPQGNVPVYASENLTDQQRYQIWESLVKSKRFEALETLVDIERFNHIFQGVSVNFITNIPESIKEARLRNLHHLGFEFESLHCAGLIKFPEDHTLNKSEMIKQLKSPKDHIVFLDDQIDNCLDMIESLPDAHIMLLSTPFNQDSLLQDGIERIENWDHFFERFQTLKLSFSAENLV